MNLRRISIVLLLAGIEQAADASNTTYASSGLKYIGIETKGIFNSDVPMVARSGLQWLSGLENNTEIYLKKSKEFLDVGLKQIDRDEIYYLKKDSVTYGYYWTGKTNVTPELVCYKEARCTLVVVYYKSNWGYHFTASYPSYSKNHVDSLKAVPKKNGQKIEYTFEIYGKKHIFVYVNQLFWYIKGQHYSNFFTKIFDSDRDFYKQYNFLKAGYPEGLIDIKVHGKIQ